MRGTGGDHCATGEAGTTEEEGAEVEVEVLELASAETGTDEPEGGRLPSGADGAAARGALEPSCAAGVAASAGGGTTGTSDTEGVIIVEA